MNINHLKYFIDAANLGGPSPAARINFVSQSAVSRAISKLEEELDVELVIHRQNSFQLTEAGDAIRIHGHKIFDSIAHLKEIAEDFSKELRGPLRIGCNEAIASKLVGPMLPSISAKYPKIDFSISLGNTDLIQKMIDQSEIDFGIVMDDGEVNKRYNTNRIFNDTFTVVKSPLFQGGDIRDQLIVSRTKSGGLSERYIREFKKIYGETITPKMVIGSWQVIMDLAIKQCGFALIPTFLCLDEIHSKRLELVSNKVKPISFGLCTIVAGNRSLPKNAKVILDGFKRLKQY